MVETAIALYVLSEGQVQSWNKGSDAVDIFIGSDARSIVVEIA